MAEHKNDDLLIIMDTPDTTTHQLKLKKYKEILMILEKDKFIHDEERKRLSKLSTKNQHKSANNDITKKIESHCYVCNVIINLENKENFIICNNCKNTICTQKQCIIEKSILNKTILLNNNNSNNNNGNGNVEQQLTPTKTCKLCNSFMKGSQSACDWLLQELNVKFANNSTQQQQQQQLEEKTIEWNKIDDTLVVPVDQRDTVREYIEELVASIIGGGSLDNVPIGQLYSNLQCLPRNENEINIDGTYDNLKMLVERIIEQVFKIPEILDHSGVPGRARQPPPEFDPKKYEELLATAVLNKVVEKFELEQKILSQRRGSDYYKKLDKNHNQWIKRSVESPTGSSTSDEPKSDHSSNHPEHPMSLNITSDIEERHQKPLSFDDLVSTPRSPTSDEEYLSDYIQNHHIPLPQLNSDESTDEFLDDKYLETLESNGIITTNGNSGVNDWQENWLFKKKKSKQNEPTTTTLSTQSIAMLVPSPTEEVKALIGDKTADEMSDLSEAGSSDSESDDDNDDELLSTKNDNDLPHILVESKTLIGGKNEVKSFDESQQMVEELLQPDSLISLNSSSEKISPILMEAKNQMIFVNVDNNNSEISTVMKLNTSSSAQTVLEKEINLDNLIKSENKDHSTEELTDVYGPVPIPTPRKSSKTNNPTDFEAISIPLIQLNNTIINTTNTPSHDINTLTIANENNNASEHTISKSLIITPITTMISPHINLSLTNINNKIEQNESDENINNNINNQKQQHDNHFTSLKLTDNLKNVIILNPSSLDELNKDENSDDVNQIYTTTTEINLLNFDATNKNTNQQQIDDKLIEIDQVLKNNNNCSDGSELLSFSSPITNQLPPIENYINKVIPSEFDILLDSVSPNTITTTNSNDIIEQILQEHNIIEDNTVPKAIYICSKPALVAVELATDEQTIKSNAQAISSTDQSINKCIVLENNEIPSAITETTTIAAETKYTILKTQHSLEILNQNDHEIYSKSSSTSSSTSSSSSTSTSTSSSSSSTSTSTSTSTSLPTIKGESLDALINLNQISNLDNLISDKQEVESNVKEIVTNVNEFSSGNPQQSTDSDDNSDFVILNSKEILDLKQEQIEYEFKLKQKELQESKEIGTSLLLPMLEEFKIIEQNINQSSSVTNQFTNPDTNQSIKSNKRPNIFDTILKDESLNLSTPLAVTDETESTEVELRSSADLPGSIAEREHLKWKNAQDIPNNPYSPEALQKRLSSGKSNKGILDIRDISPTKQQSIESLDEELSKTSLSSISNNNNDDTKLKIVIGAGEPDHIRYGRDYYINDSNTETKKKQMGITKTTTLPGDNSTATDIGIVYTAQPVHIVEEYSFQSTSGKTEEQLSSPTTQQPNDSSLTLSEDSDTTRVYDLNKRETSLIRPAIITNKHSSTEYQDFSAQTPPSSPIDESILIKSQQEHQSSNQLLLLPTKKPYYLEDGITFQQLNQVKKAFEDKVTSTSTPPPPPPQSFVKRSSSFQFNKTTTMSDQEVFIRESSDDVVTVVEITPDLPPPSPPSPTSSSPIPLAQIEVLDKSEEKVETYTQEFIPLSEEPQIDIGNNATTKMVIEEEVLPVLPSVKALAKSFIEKRTTTDDQPINRPKTIDWYITQDNGVENGNQRTNESSDINFNGAHDKFELLSSSQGDESFPNYNQAYHPVAQHSITARSVPTKIREELKKSSTIFETNNQQGGHTSPERSPSPVLVPGILKNNVAFFENLKNSK